MIMFDHKHYVPILKGKDGEYGALKELPTVVKSRLTPLIETPPIPWDFVNEVPAKTIDSHLEKVCEKIGGCWDTTRPLFLDLLWIPESERMSDSRHPVTFVFEDCRSKGLRLIPVTGLRRATTYQDAVKDVIATDKLGVCVRLENEDFVGLSKLSAKLADLLKDLGARPQDTDLILDFKEVPASQTSAIVIAAQSILATLPNINEWRTLTLAATGFPSSLGGITAASFGTISRSEWIIWTTLANNRTELPRLPTFGDYGINHPDPLEIDPRVMKMSANLRYAVETEWLILKGRSVKDYGFEQFHGLCKTMLGRPEYKGAAFSWGDEYINDCAGRTSNPGNATTWRKVGTNHHLALVVEQIASFPGL
jgi:hypothetical protein